MAADATAAEQSRGAPHRSFDSGEHDLTDLFDYIAADSGVDRADAVLRRIGQTLESLAMFPRIGRVRDDLDGSPRAFSVWPWLVIYEPSEDGIFVWRIIDGRRDIRRLVTGAPKR
jgi:plasmid stabilization system protein ParE